MSLGDDFKSSVLPLPDNLQKQIEAGWKNLFIQNKLFPIIIHEKSKFHDHIRPRPFPKLKNLILSQFEEESLQKRDSPSIGKLLEPRTTLLNTSIRDLSKDRIPSRMKRFVTNSNSNLHASRRKSAASIAAAAKTGIPRPRPNSAPLTRPICLSVPTPTPLSGRRISSAERIKKLQISPVDLQQVPDDQDHLHDQLRRNSSSEKRSNSANAVKPTVSSSWDSTSASVPWSIQNHFLSLSHEDGNRNTQIRDHVSDALLNSSSHESKSDLIVKGVELLTAGRDIIKNSRQDTNEKTQTLEDVAYRLHEIVNGELKALKDENDALKRKNAILKQQLMNFTRAEDTSAATTISTVRTPRTTPTATPSTSQRSVIPRELNKISSTLTSIRVEKPVVPSNVKNSNANAPTQLQSHFRNPETPVIPSQVRKVSTSPTDVVSRVIALEETVTQLLKSNAEQTSILQDRMYQQETRYEETLSKFEEVIANMTNMFAGLQATYNLQSNNPNPSSITTAGFVEALDNIVKASRKKVQFRGILKP